MKRAVASAACLLAVVLYFVFRGSTSSASPDWSYDLALAVAIAAVALAVAAIAAVRTERGIARRVLLVALSVPALASVGVFFWLLTELPDT